MQLFKLTGFRVLFFCLLTILLYYQFPACAQHQTYSLDSLGPMAESQSDSVVSSIQQLIQKVDDFAEPGHQAQEWLLIADLYKKSGVPDSSKTAFYQAIKSTENCQKKLCADLRYQAVYQLRNLLWNIEERKRVKELLALLSDYQLDNRSEASINCLLGMTYNGLGNYDEAIKTLNKAIGFSRKAEDREIEMRSFFNLSMSHQYTHNLEKSLFYKRKCLKISQAIADQDFTQYMHFSLGQLFSKINQFDSAKHHYQAVIELTQHDYNNDNYAYALNGLLDIAVAKKAETAKSYAERIKVLLQVRKPSVNRLVKRNLLASLNDYYLSIGAYQQAIDYSQKHIEYVKTFSNDTSETMVYALGYLAKTQAAGGDYKSAYATQNRYHDIKMAMVQRNQQEATAQAAVEMDLADNELARQQAEQAILLEQQASASRSRFFLLLLSLSGLILAGVSWAYRRVQLDKKIISEQKVLVEQSLEEKEVLLREIHHRVKNNLQIISSLLDKQARKSSDAAVRKLVKEGQERIQSMALIHQNLYESDQLSGIDIKSYLQELSKNIQKSQAITADQVQLELNVDNEKLDIDTAIPVGLILNELLTNSYKYAFAQTGNGKITVDLKKEDEQYHLRVCDDGVGFSSGKEAGGTKSLGLNLVNGLVRQLDGTIEWLKVNQGVAVAIRF